MKEQKSKEISLNGNIFEFNWVVVRFCIQLKSKHNQRITDETRFLDSQRRDDFF